MDYKKTSDTIEAGLVLQKLYTTLSNNNNLALIKSPHNIIPQNGKSWIESVIDIEMRHIQSNYQFEEDQYAEKMVTEQPPLLSLRRNPRENEIKDVIQLQKAESCRRSRMNTKIRKSKSRFRHEYIAQKLTKSATILRCIHEVIAHAENKFIQGGFNKRALKELRTALGMDKPISIDAPIDLRVDNNNSTM